MDKVAAGAVTAVWHSDVSQAQRWFELIRDQHQALAADGGAADWDRFKQGFTKRATADAFDQEVVNQFVAHLEAASTAPMDVIAQLADPNKQDEVLQTYSTALAAAYAWDGSDQQTAHGDAQLWYDDEFGLLRGSDGTSWFLADGTTRVYPDESGYFYDDNHNWYLHGQLVPHDDGGSVEPEAVESAVEPVTAEQIQEAEAIVQDVVQATVESVLANVSDLADEMGVSEEKLQSLISEMGEAAVAEIVLAELADAE